jgi:hypothetical protein
MVPVLEGGRLGSRPLKKESANSSLRPQQPGVILLKTTTGKEGNGRPAVGVFCGEVQSIASFNVAFASSTRTLSFTHELSWQSWLRKRSQCPATGRHDETLVPPLPHRHFGLTTCSQQHPSFIWNWVTLSP